MTDTEIAPEQGEDEATQYWAGSSAIQETPVPDEGTPAPPAAEARPERPRLFVKLGHVFSGGPNGK